eukprot:scaffold581_cov263-Pinguiococcus_pyrenoidosus.AAC.7
MASPRQQHRCNGVQPSASLRHIPLAITVPCRILPDPAVFGKLPAVRVRAGVEKGRHGVVTGKRSGVAQGSPSVPALLHIGAFLAEPVDVREAVFLGSSVQRVDGNLLQLLGALPANPSEQGLDLHDLRKFQGFAACSSTLAPSGSDYPAEQKRPEGSATHLCRHTKSAHFPLAPARSRPGGHCCPLTEGASRTWTE